MLPDHCFFTSQNFSWLYPKSPNVGICRLLSPGFEPVTVGLVNRDARGQYRAFLGDTKRMLLGTWKTEKEARAAIEGAVMLDYLMDKENKRLVRQLDATPEDRVDEYLRDN